MRRRFVVVDLRMMMMLVILVEMQVLLKVRVFS